MRETERSGLLDFPSKEAYNCSNRIKRNGAVDRSAALTSHAKGTRDMATPDIISPISSASNSALPKVEIYCDGAAIPNPGAAGIGVILLFGTVKKEICEPIGRATNQAAEIQAATTALMALNRPCHVTIYSDSQYLIKTMNGEYSRKANIELWNDLEDRKSVV